MSACPSHLVTAARSSASCAARRSAQPAWAGIEEAVKAMQAGDVATAEKELQVLVKERDPRAQFLARPLRLRQSRIRSCSTSTRRRRCCSMPSERGYVPAMIPLAGAYAEGKGVPKSVVRCLQVDRSSPSAGTRRMPPQLLEQVGRELKPDEIEKAKAAAAGLHLQDEMIAAAGGAARGAARRCSGRRARANRPMRPTSRRRCARRSRPIAPAISPTAESRSSSARRERRRCRSLARRRAARPRRRPRRPAPLQHAAERRLGEGAHRLALVYAQGLAGTPRDEQRALELFEKAAAAGHVAPQINLGMLYLRGQGVPRDLVQARAWLEKAAAQRRSLRALRAGPRHGRERGTGRGRSGARRRSLSTRRRSKAMPSPRCATAWR